MTGNISQYSDKQLLSYIIRDLKRLGKIPTTTNHNHQLRLTTAEIKQISKDTGLPTHQLFIYYG